MYELLAKTDSKNLLKFKKNFKFEAYIGKKYEPEFYYKSRKKFKNIHLPTFFIKKNKKFNLNLISENNFVKKESFKILNLYFNLCKKTKIKNLIIHGGFYDSTKPESLYFHLLNLNKNLKKFFSNEVNLFFENVPKWFNQYQKNSPINSNLEELKLFKTIIPNSNILIDVDHLSINYAFEYFYNTFNFKNFKNQKLEKIYLKFAKKNHKKIKNLINKKIKNVVNFINPKLVHAVGSDFLNYTSYKKLPLIGEGLPLNFSGKIKGRDVSDKINHNVWMNNKNIKLITVEIIKRNDYLYEEEITKSFKYIKLNKKYVSNNTSKKR